MCVVLRHKVIGNLLQQQKNTGTFRKKTMSYSASRTLGAFPWMLTGSISFFYTWNHSSISGGGPQVRLKLGTVSREKKVYICEILQRLKWQNLKVSKNKHYGGKDQKCEFKPLILKIFAWQSQQPHTEKHIQHTIHPTIAEFTDALARGSGNSYILREGLDGLLDIFQCYNSIIIIKSKN